MSDAPIITATWERTGILFPDSAGSGDADLQYYAAFGSNLLRARLCKRTGRAVVAARYRIAGWRQNYGKQGKANAVEDPGSVLPIAVYEMTAPELCKLDVCEGSKYVRTEFRIKGGQTVWTYLMKPGPAKEKGDLAEEYLGFILDGLRGHGFLEEVAIKEKERTEEKERTAS